MKHKTIQEIFRIILLGGVSFLISSAAETIAIVYLPDHLLEWTTKYLFYVVLIPIWLISFRYVQTRRAVAYVLLAALLSLGLSKSMIFDKRKRLNQIKDLK